MQENDYETLIAPNRERMTRAVWRIVRDPLETEDALQEALMRIVREIDRIRSHPNPTALILRICNNAALDHVRKRTRRAHLFERWRKAPGWPPPTVEQPAAEAGELQEAVIRALANLPQAEAEAMLLISVEELDNNAAAVAMGCKASTVRVLVARARERLRQNGVLQQARNEFEGKRHAE